MDIKEFQQLQEDLKVKQSEVDKAKGAYDSVMETLKEEHGVETIKEAKALLKKEEAALSKKEKEYEEALETFKEDFKDELDI